MTSTIAKATTKMSKMFQLGGQSTVQSQYWVLLRFVAAMLLYISWLVANVTDTMTNLVSTPPSAFSGNS